MNNLTAVNPTEALQSRLGKPDAVKPSQVLADDFTALMDPSPPVSQTVQGFVNKAEESLKVNDTVLNTQLDNFGETGQVFALLQAIHESSMRSVSIQLTSKVGSKVSESFEQLIKQQ